MTLVTDLSRPFPQASRLALDIETQGLEWWLHRPVLLQLSDGQDAISLDVRPYVNHPWDPIGPHSHEIGDWLREHVYDRLIVGHNLMFDLAWLKYWFGVDYPKRLWDTRVAEQVRYCGLIGSGHGDQGNQISASLKYVAERYLGVDLDKGYQLSFLEENGFDFDTSEISPEQVKYGEDDVRFLLDIMELQQEALRQDQLMDIAEIEMDVLPVFTEMRVRGIKVDRSKIKPLLDKAAEERDRLEIELQGDLTPYVHFERMQKYKEEIRPRVEYKARVREITRKAVDDWHSLVDPGTDGWARSMRESWEEQGWLDMKPHTKNPWPWGCQRVVNKRLKEFRAEHGGMPSKPNFNPYEPINLNSPDQMKIALTNLIGEEPVNTRKGTIKAIIGQHEDENVIRILTKLLAYRKAFKLVSSFGPELLAKTDDNDRLHGDYNQIVSTGRPSSSSPNMLNLPNAPEFRACFVADEGMKLVIADYSQIEYRIMAELAGERWIIDAYKKGEDFHTKKAAQVFEVPEEEITKQQRSAAKIINFGRNYGMMGNTLRANMAEQQIYVSKEEADRWVEQDDRITPRLTRYRKQQGHLALKRGYAETPFGRRRYFDMDAIENQWDRFGIMRQAANMPIQGGNADIMKVAMRVVQDAVKPYGASIVLQIYDELVVETPEEHAEEVARLVRAGMEAAGEILLKEIPIEVDCFISPSWSEAEGREVT